MFIFIAIAYIVTAKSNRTIIRGEFIADIQRTRYTSLGSKKQGSNAVTSSGDSVHVQVWQNAAQEISMIMPRQIMLIMS